MKLEIEITEQEIRDALERKVRVAIADQTNNYRSDDFIKEQVKLAWSSAVTSMINEQLADSEAIKNKIRASIEAKLKGQLTAMMKGPK